MKFLLSIAGGLADLIQWVIGYGQRQIGKQEQQNADAQKTIKTLEAEQNVAANPASASDELRNGKF